MGKSAYRIGLLGLAILALAGAASGSPADSLPTDTLIYKRIGTKVLRLYRFKPPAAPSRPAKPAIVLFHGGGWKNGSPSQLYFQAGYFASQGLLAFSAQYRLHSTDGTKPSAAVEDGKSAIRYVREHAAELGVDPALIFAGGGSAGGHVAASTGLLTILDNPKENAAISSRPNGLVLFNPVINTMPDGYGYTFIGPDSALLLSPVDHVGRDAPPTVILTGTRDTTTPLANQVEFQARMLALGRICELDTFPGVGHGFFNREPYRTQTLVLAQRFLDRLIAGPVRVLRGNHPIGGAMPRPTDGRFDARGRWLWSIRPGHLVRYPAGHVASLPEPSR